MVKVIVSADPRYRVNKSYVEEAVIASLRTYNVKSDVEVEVTIVGDRKMLELNKTYRGMDYVPEVLTFALEDPNPQSLTQNSAVGFVASPDRVLRLGTIAISYPQAVEDASVDGKSVEDEIVFLVDHGMKHLLGMHHD